MELVAHVKMQAVRAVWQFRGFENRSVRCDEVDRGWIGVRYTLETRFNRSDFNIHMRQALDRKRPCMVDLPCRLDAYRGWF